MSLLAGAATRDLTPRDAVQLCGYPHVGRLATGVHDPLLASVLFLSNGASTVLVGALDLLMLNGDVARRLRRSVAQALGLAESAVLLSCTHTHSGPSTLDYLPWRDDPAMPPPDSAYLRRVEVAMVEAALEARDRAEPAGLTWAAANARGLGGNRHAPDGPTDPEAGVLAVRAADRFLALAVIYGMHPTVLHEDSTLISGDFPHYVRLHLQETLGRELVVLYHTGPAGDQSPRYHVAAQTFAEAERLGRKLGAAVLESLGHAVSPELPVGAWIGDPQCVAPGPARRSAERGGRPSRLRLTEPRSGRRGEAGFMAGMQVGEDRDPEQPKQEQVTSHEPVVLAGALQSVDLPRRRLPSVEEAERRLATQRARYEQLRAAGAGRAEVRTAEVAAFGAEGLVRLARAQASGELDDLLARCQPFEVQALRIGEACLVGFPGELFAEYGLRLKASTPLKSYPIAYANGECQGYIVTPEAAAVGGYEAAGSLFEPDAGGLLVNAAVSLVADLAGASPGTHRP